MDKKLLQDFYNLFSGYTKGYGVYILTPRNQKKGTKIKGKAHTKLEPLTIGQYEQHLLAEKNTGLGVVPVDEEGQISFAAIDVDKYNIDIKEMEKKINSLNIPLLTCSTKSGGVHLFLFLKKKTDAKTIREKLLEFSFILGVGGSEIFPKQNRISKEDDCGNWINLPYFDYKQSDRVCIRNGQKLSLKAFLEHAKAKATSKSALDKIDLQLDEDIVDAPVCLQRLCTEGITLGKKNNSLLNLGVFAKLKWPDEWITKLKELNKKYVKPPAKQSTLKGVVAPLRRKDYFYTCTVAPLVDVCNREDCRKQDFGIGNIPSLDLGKLTKILTDPPTWDLEVEDKEIELGTEDLLSQEKFRKICIEQLNLLPFKVKSDVWDDLIRQKLEDVEIIEAPDDAGTEGQFMQLVDEFCSNRALAKNKDELLMGKPWIESKSNFIYFRSSDLLQHLDRNKFRDFKAKKIWSTLKRHGAVYERFKLKGRNIRVWGIPMTERQTKDFKVPKVDKGEF